MKVFYLITDLDVGGAEKALCRLAGGLPRSLFSPVVACLTGAGELGSALSDQDVPVCHVRMKGRLDIGAVGRVADLLWDHRPDIVHTFLFHANLVGRIAAWLAGTPIVISSVRVAEPRPHHLWLDAWTHRLVNVETCVSESVRRYLLSNRVMPERKLVTVANGVDVEEYAVSGSTLRQELGIGEGVTVVLAIGRLEKQKGMRHLLAAAADRVLRGRQDFAFVIAGEGPLRDGLERFAARKGIAERVRFLGFRKDVPNLIAGCDLLVVPSLWEGMPNVILEAMAGGRPVIATDVEGCRELVAPGRTGVLVPKGRPRALAEAILSFRSDEAKWREMGRAGHQRAVREFTLRRMIDANISIYLDQLRLSEGSFPADLWRRKRLA